MIYMVEFGGSSLAFNFARFANTRCDSRYYAGYAWIRKGKSRRTIKNSCGLWATRRERTEGYVVSVFERGKGGYFSPQLFGFKETA